MYELCMNYADNTTIEAFNCIIKYICNISITSIESLPIIYLLIYVYRKVYVRVFEFSVETLCTVKVTVKTLAPPNIAPVADSRCEQHIILLQRAILDGANKNMLITDRWAFALDKSTCRIHTIHHIRRVRLW